MNLLCRDPATIAERREAAELQALHGCWACGRWQPVRPGHFSLYCCERGLPDAGHRNTECRDFDLNPDFRADAYQGPI